MALLTIQNKYLHTETTPKYKQPLSIYSQPSLNRLSGMVGLCREDIVYLTRTSPGRPTDIGLQLGTAC